MELLAALLCLVLVGMGLFMADAVRSALRPLPFQKPQYLLTARAAVLVLPVATKRISAARTAENTEVILEAA